MLCTSSIPSSELHSSAKGWRFLSGVWHELLLLTVYSGIRGIIMCLAPRTEITLIRLTSIITIIDFIRSGHLRQVVQVLH